MNTNFPKLTQQAILHVDATPDGDYALRILRAYRENCNAKWANSTDGSVHNPLLIEMNRQQDLRAAELDEAIKVLQWASAKSDAWR